VKVTIASRGSKLALRQSEIVARLIQRHHPAIEIDIRPVKTRGDKDARPFGSIGGRGLFVAEVEREVEAGRADLAVHSAKDLTAELAPGCTIACVPARASVGDVVVGGRGESGEQRLASLRPGARVGTSSTRRRALLRVARRDLEITDLRGNLDTRLRKVAAGEVDAAILAAAGIERLGVSEEVSAALLDPERWIPPPGQGALAVEARTDRPDLIELLAPLDDVSAHAEVVAERAFAARMEGGCSVPLGCLARATESRLVVTGFLGHPEGDEEFRDLASGTIDEAPRLGRELADGILRAGGKVLLDELEILGGAPVDAP
jgi:hydroxymethylbilane synthase